MKPPDVLQRIAQDVSKRLAERQALVSREAIHAFAQVARTPHDFEAAFRGPGIHTLAEIKFRSPALGVLESAGLELALKIAGSYLAGGTAGISVLTEQDHFHGSPEYLKAIRLRFPEARLLMKDFVIDEYQLAEARVWGADAVLLIVALLGPEQTKALLAKARALQLAVLVEVHDEVEFDQALAAGASLIGVNNRNLKTLEVSLENSFRMASKITSDKIYISESGIGCAEDLQRLHAFGYQGFLVGSTLMTAEDPGTRLRELIKEAE